MPARWNKGPGPGCDGLEVTVGSRQRAAGSLGVARCSWLSSAPGTRSRRRRRLTQWNIFYSSVGHWLTKSEAKMRDESWRFCCFVFGRDHALKFPGTKWSSSNYDVTRGKIGQVCCFRKAKISTFIRFSSVCDEYWSHIHWDLEFLKEAMKT